MDEPWIRAKYDRLFSLFPLPRADPAGPFVPRLFFLKPVLMGRIRVEASSCNYSMEQILFKYVKSYLDKEV
jgi:hypothetical protein